MRYKILTFIFLTIFLFACDIFSTRTPQEPIVDTNSNPPATTPQIVISNFASAIQNKNIFEYEKLFSDTIQNGKIYIFKPTSSAKVKYSSLFQLWNKTSEKQFITKFFNSLKSGEIPSLTFSNAKYEYTFSDSALFSANYQFSAKHNVASVPKQFYGKFYLLLSKNSSNIWSISTWEDFETSIDSSFSDCKGAFSL